jgi:hypothetical protein
MEKAKWAWPIGGPARLAKATRGGHPRETLGAGSGLVGAVAP